MLESFLSPMSLPTFFSHVDIRQYSGTNFTAFRLIDTNKPEIISVVHDIVSKEIMSQGKKLDFPVSFPCPL